MRIATTILTLLVTACGSNPAYVQEAAKVMGDNQSCMRAIQGRELMGFNHMAGVVIAGKVSVSVATDGKNSACGFATNAPNDVVESKLIDGYGVNWEKLDQVSLARCEKNKRTIKEPCRVFSHNYEIIYGKEAEDAK